MRALSGPEQSIKITDHFICTSANVYYITCETGRRLGDRFREHHANCNLAHTELHIDIFKICSDVPAHWNFYRRYLKMAKI